MGVSNSKEEIPCICIYCKEGRHKDCVGPSCMCPCPALIHNERLTVSSCEATIAELEAKILDVSRERDQLRDEIAESLALEAAKEIARLKGELEKAQAKCGSMQNALEQFGQHEEGREGAVGVEVPYAGPPTELL